MEFDDIAEWVNKMETQISRVLWLKDRDKKHNFFQRMTNAT